MHHTDPAEHTFTQPAHWRRLLHPRRGGLPGPSPHPGRQALTLLEPLLPALRDAVHHPRGEPAPAKAALAFLDGEPTPPGAAALASMVAVKPGTAPKKSHLERIADLWLLDHGPAFAAEAATCLPLLSAGFDADGFHVREAIPPPRNCGLPADPVVHRLRAHLAEASEVDYRTAVGVLAGHRHTPGQRGVAAFLAPGEAEWAEEFVAEALALGHRAPAEAVLCTLGTGAQLAAACAADTLAWALRNPRVIPTLVDGVGVAAVPALATWATYYGAETTKRVAEALAVLPSDDAFESLLDLADHRPAREALPLAMKRFPVRSLRLLARRCAGPSKPARFAERLLRARVLVDPVVVDEALPTLDEQTRTVVERVRAENRPFPEAPEDALPRVLVVPPWAKPRAITEQVVLDLDPGKPQVTWAPGEREAWRAAKTWAFQQPDALEKAVGQLRAGVLDAHLTGQLLAHGPDEVSGPLLERWRPADLWFAESWLPPALARHELAALPLALHVARAIPQAAGEFLAPFASAEVAALMADWLARLKGRAREVALAWLDRHATTAARLLIPVALGEPGRTRSAAEAAVDHLDPAIVDRAAQAHGPAAAAAMSRFLATDPLDVLPARIPELPDWADPASLPPLLLPDQRALPTAAVRYFLTMLAMSRPGEPYAGVTMVTDLLDRGSLARFGWELFEAWQAVGSPSAHGWPLSALAWLGDDEVARELAVVIRALPGEGGHIRAVLGLDVLAELGTDTALMQLHAIAQKVKFKALKARATDKITEVATGLGLTAEQLADRLVPGFGLSAEGKLRLDYGPRQFLVGFDEQLKPFVTDTDGKRRRELPKPGVRDDADRATAARKRFAALKKDVRTVAADQVRRLERAMVHGREWTVDEFRRLFVEHPLLWHIARRLVWLADSGDGVRAFRIAEDRTFADVADNPFRLTDGDTVRIAHPVHLGETVAAWAELFADYEILQPFRQLGREVHKLTAAERAHHRLDRFADHTVPAGKLFGLGRSGWERSAAQDDGMRPWLFRRVGEASAVVIGLDPGIPFGLVDELPEQRITAVWLNDRPEGALMPRVSGLSFGSLDPVTASEVLAELTELIR
ncbi:DUF4132 domain-containing protein [Amycolatopsis sp. 195334CR]|uniref:DUF4132 domain-containing protein n=1 Tax=Amycolatopsis sp. 195334CR TaxID=2814588 RepID=UPI001A8CC702|nr:DUF4132 domain-containing protein [Amycolatopsis sp. 195334CR]MBN6037060.1 DUF4132 domain-containing protein [Amycolatopsis sp. 195334CR]